MPAPSNPPLAYSYIRFSHPSQSAGDSLRRQTETAADWCRRRGCRLDLSTTLHDLGKSAFTGEHRKNPDRHALAAFLKLVEGGKVPKGSYLVLENLDRLSREHIRPALTLLLNLIESGVRVVQLKPVEQVFDDKVEPMQLMMAIMELSRGHGESRVKSERNGAAWVEKRRLAREEGRALTRRLPAWVEEHEGRLRLIPARAAVVRRIFHLSAAGYGITQVTRTLVQENVPPFGGLRWTRGYVAKIARDRRALGEFQPRTRGGAPDGDPIPNYFPAVIGEAEWNAARGGAMQRRDRPGRMEARVNLFTGLLRDARDGSAYYARTRTGVRVLFNANANEGRASSNSFPADTFEVAILSLLREIDPREVLGSGDAADGIMELSGRLEQVEQDIAALVADLDAHGESPTLYRRLREKERAKGELAESLAQAQARAASPLSASWAELPSLLAALASATDPMDARLRLRSMLRRVVESIWLLVVPRGQDRLAAVQIWFAGGEGRHRDYLIWRRPAKANGHGRVADGSYRAWSLTDIAAPGDLDLTKRSHAKRLAKALGQLDLDALE